MEQYIDESLISNRAFEFLGAIAVTMGQSFVGPNHNPKFNFRAVFRPEEPKPAVKYSPSFDGTYFIEGEGRGIGAYYPYWSDERRLAADGFVPVLSLRLLGCHRWDDAYDIHPPPLLSDEEAFRKTATAVYYAPLLVPGTFLEDMRRFMRDYLGHDEIRTCKFVPTPGQKTRAWQTSCI